MQRGDVYRLRPPKSSGHEQRGQRFGIVLQANELLPRSVIIVAPTSQSARAASFRPEVEVSGAPTRVLVEQLGAVDSQRLGRRAGRLTAQEMWAVEEAISTVLGLG